MRTADELIHDIVSCSNIPSLKRRREIQRELSTHIEDFVAAARQAGHQEHEIETLLLTHFGDPGQIAQGFSRVYRFERRRLLTLVYALSTMILASSLLMVILAIQSGLAFGFGTPVLKILASRHTVIQALDILAFVSVYLGLTSLETLFELHRFQKAALRLLGIVAVLIASCAATGLPIAFLFYGLIAGTFFRAVHLFVLATIARAAIVLVCFALAGLGFAQLHSPVSPVDLVATCASWLALGTAYLFMSHLAPRVDAALLNELQRI